RLRNEGRLHRHGRLPGGMEMGTGRGPGRRAAGGRRHAGGRVDGGPPARETAEPDNTESILDDLQNSQQLMIAMLRVSAEDPSARVGAWDLRDIAAHLAASEREA